MIKISVQALFHSLQEYPGDGVADMRNQFQRILDEKLRAELSSEQGNEPLSVRLQRITHDVQGELSQKTSEMVQQAIGKNLQRALAHWYISLVSDIQSLPPENKKDIFWDRLSPFYSAYLHNNFSPQEQQLLVALLQRKDSTSQEDIEGILVPGCTLSDVSSLTSLARTTLSPLFQRLQRKNILTKMGKNYVIADPIFALWLSYRQNTRSTRWFYQNFPSKKREEVALEKILSGDVLGYILDAEFAVKPVKNT